MKGGKRIPVDGEENENGILKRSRDDHPQSLLMDKSDTQVNKESYECENCGILPVSRFSKSKINQFERGKICVIYCTECTQKAVEEDERQKKSMKEERLKKKVIEKKARNLDPSTKYASNPLHAPIVQEASSFFKEHGLREFKTYLGPTQGWRTVSKLAVRGVIKSSSKPSRDKTSKHEGSSTISTMIGLFEPGSHDVVPCTTSVAHHPAINEAASAVENACGKLHIHGYIEGTGYDADICQKHSAYLKYIILAVERATSKVQLTLVWNSFPPGGSETESQSQQSKNKACEHAESCLARLVEELSSINMSTALLNQRAGSVGSSGSQNADCSTCTSTNTNKKSSDITNNSTAFGSNHNIEKSGCEIESESSSPLLFHSIWVNYNPSSKHVNTITGREEGSWRLLFGEKHIKEPVITDMIKPPKLRFPPTVFRQANIDAFSNIIRAIRWWIRDFQSAGQDQPDSGSSNSSNNKSGSGTASAAISKNIEEKQQSKKRKFKEEKEMNDEKAAIMLSSSSSSSQSQSHSPSIKCVELYGGVGTIGLNCLDLLSVLSCSDENPNNKACFDATLQKIKPSSLRSRASYESLSASAVAVKGGLRGYDLVLVDPPRKGLDEEVIEALLSYNTFDPRPNRRLIYVSCGFKAFQRDAARLLGEYTGRGSGNSGYQNRGNSSVNYNSISHSNMNSMNNSNSRIRYWKLIHAEGHVLFPGSDHIETLAIFDRVI